MGEQRSNFNPNDLGGQPPCLAVFPISPRFGKVDLEILKQLADVYYAFLYYELKDMFDYKPSEIKSLIYEQLKAKKGEFFEWMAEDWLTTAPTKPKIQKENLCRYYLWVHHFCMQPCPKGKGLKFVIEKITKINTTPPSYAIKLWEHGIIEDVRTRDLFSFEKFRHLVFENFGFVVEKPSEPWVKILDFLSESHLENHSLGDMNRDELQEFNEGDLLEPINTLLNRDFINEQEEDDLDYFYRPILRNNKIYATGQALYNAAQFLRISRRHFFKILKNLGFRNTVIKVKGKCLRVWEIPEVAYPEDVKCVISAHEVT